jgi:hypothetical protein
MMTAWARLKNLVDENERLKETAINKYDEIDEIIFRAI